MSLSAAEARARPRSEKEEHLLGLSLVFLVAVIWVGSSELIQFIFGDSDFAKPFFLTYLSTSLFSVYLLEYFLNPAWREWLRDDDRSSTNTRYRELQQISGEATEEATADHCAARQFEDSSQPSRSKSLLSDRIRDGDPAGISMSSVHLSQDHAPPATSHTVTVHEEIPTQDGILEAAPSDTDGTEWNGLLTPAVSTLPRSRVGLAPYGPGDALRVASYLGPLFFVSNYLFNLGLGYTSVASSSTIATLSTLFSLFIASAYGVERFSIGKLMSALLTFGGVALISNLDKGKGGKASLIGDAVSVVSAFLYGSFNVFLKRAVPTERVLDMRKLFGFVGVVIALTLWPVVVFFHFTGVEVFEIPSPRVSLLLLLNALVGSVLSDYLSARSVALLTPTIASLALSLTVPLSLAVDYWVRDVRFPPAYLVGAAFVIAGFVVANVDEAWSRLYNSSNADGERLVVELEDAS